jgi:hypothetical protein
VNQTATFSKEPKGAEVMAARPAELATPVGGLAQSSVATGEHMPACPSVTASGDVSLPAAQECAPQGDAVVEVLSEKQYGHLRNTLQMYEGTEAHSASSSNIMAMEVPESRQSGEPCGEYDAVTSRLVTTPFGSPPRELVAASFQQQGAPSELSITLQRLPTSPERDRTHLGIKVRPNPALKLIRTSLQCELQLARQRVPRPGRQAIKRGALTCSLPRAIG